MYTARDLSPQQDLTEHYDTDIGHLADSSHIPRISPAKFYLSVYRDPLGFFCDVGRRFPELAQTKIGRRIEIVVSSPAFAEQILAEPEETMHFGLNNLIRDVMGKGLLSIQGSQHREQKIRLKPLFHQKELASYAPTMVREGLAMAESWTNGEIRDVVDDIGAVGMNIIGQVLFERDPEEFRPFAKTINDAVDFTGRRGLMHRIIVKELMRREDPLVSRVTRQVDEAVCPWIASARSGEHRSESAMLHKMMNIHDRTWPDHEESDRWTRDELVTLMFAGYETTATSISWNLMLFAQNDAVQSRIHAELDEVLQGSPATIKDIPKLKFLTAAFRETLRLYPPIWLLIRRPLIEYKLGKYTIPRRAYLFISPYALHRNPKSYAEPDRFVPDRFLRGPEATSSEKSIYIPFGSGTKRCIGETMAQVQGVLLLACIMQRWKLQPAPGHVVQAAPLISLRPKNGVKLKVERRSAS